MHKESSIQDIIIIGTGHVAHVLGRLIKSRGFNVVQVLGRSEANTIALATELSAKPITSPGEICDKAHLAIVAISDTALVEIRKWISHAPCPIVHTAGSVDMQVLEGLHDAFGVLYPLQSLRANQTGMPEIPFFVEGNQASFERRLLTFASQLSAKAQIADMKTRVSMHLAAVSSANFFNHLCALSWDYCNSNGLDPALLLPLLHETMRRMEHAHPSEMQTGPAIRGDETTMQLHLSMLEANPELRHLYREISASIIHYHARKQNT